MPKTVSQVASLSESFLSTPAYILAIAYIIVCVIIILPFELKIYNDATSQYEVIEYNFLHRLLLILYLLLPIILHVYSVNCMMVGNCTLWSYIYTFIHVVWIVVFIIIAFSYTMRKH
jgi:hypothetical protein